MWDGALRGSVIVPCFGCALSPGCACAQWCCRHDIPLAWDGGQRPTQLFLPPLLCRDGYFHYTGILCWERLYCSSFPIASKRLVYFPLQSTVTVGSSVASPALPPPGVEGPRCWDPALGTREQLPWDTALSVAHDICAVGSFCASP